MKEKRRWFRLGLSAGIPICLGYFAVSFALGIAAREADITALQATLMSLTCVTSTGEYAAITLIGSGAVYLEMAVTQAIVNMRYLLMSTALTQKLAPKTSFLHRLCLSYCMTDELFGISIAQEGKLCPWYTYGATIVAVFGWCAGTCLGVIVGNILPARLVSALGVALFGMFVAIVVPEMKKTKPVILAVAIAAGVSVLLHYVFTFISAGFSIVISGVVASAITALFFPIKEDTEE